MRPQSETPVTATTSGQNYRDDTKKHSSMTVNKFHRRIKVMYTYYNVNITTYECIISRTRFPYLRRTLSKRWWTWRFLALWGWETGLVRFTRRVRCRLIRQRRRLQVVWIQVVMRTERGYRRHVLTWMGCHHPTMIQAHRLASAILRLPCCVARYLIWYNNTALATKRHSVSSKSLTSPQVIFSDFFQIWHRVKYLTFYSKWLYRLPNCVREITLCIRSTLKRTTIPWVIVRLL